MKLLTFLPAYISLAVLLPNLRLVAEENLNLKTPYFYGRDCGPESLFAVSLYHGVDTTISEIKKLAGKVDGDHFTLLDLKRTAEKLGFEVEGRNMNFKALQNSRTLVIAHCNGTECNGGVGHFVVVFEATRDTVTVLDNATERHLSKETFLSSWSGNCLLIKKK